MEKRDYMDPACPFDTSMWHGGAPPQHGKKLDVRPALERYDACMARGETAQAGTILEETLAEARACGDRRA